MSNENAKPADSTFCQIMKPIYYNSKASGLWPQSFLQASPGVTVFDIAYLVLLYAMFIYCILVNINGKLWDYYMEPFGSDILRYGLQTHIVNGLCLGLLIMTINIVQYKRKWEYMNLMDSITKVIEQEFFVKNPVRVVQIFISCVIIGENIYLLLVLSGYYFLIDKTLNIHTTYLYASYYLMNVSTLGLMNEYTYYTVHIRRLFAVVNRLMKQLLLEEGNSETILLDQGRKTRTPTIAYDEIFTIYGKPTKDFGAEGARDIKRSGLPKVTMVAPASDGFNTLSMSTIYNTYITKLRVDKLSNADSLLKTINRLSVLHYHLCDAIRLVNRIGSLPLMFHFGAMFVFLVFGLFTIYKAFNSGSWAFQVMAFANGSWIGYYLLGIVMVITGTTVTQATGRQMGDILHQIIRKHQRNFSSDVIERVANHVEIIFMASVLMKHCGFSFKLSTLSLQIKMRDMSFSCGLFHFDWNLFGSILSALAMYLVFLIQFDVTPPVGLSSPNLTVPSVEIIDFHRP